jgi:phage terminase large subunit-like protein
MNNLQSLPSHLRALLSKNPRMLSEILWQESQRRIQRKKSHEQLQAQGKLSLKDFILKFWDQAVPTNKLIDNWHIDIISEHLEAAYRRQIKKLAINIPYRSSKSSVISTLFPAWIWTIDPKETFLCASFASELALRDAGFMSDLVQSDEYQALYGDTVQIRQDRSAVSKFYNTQGGYRISLGSGAQLTGHGASVRIFDDPNMPGESDEQRQQMNERFDNRWESRFNSENDISIIVQQRTAQDDLTGHVIDKELGFEVLKIPLRYEGQKYFTTSLGLEDPRTAIGEIVDKQRFTDDFWKKEEKRLGIEANAQLQQNPAASTGEWFSRTCERISVLPNNLMIVRYWDKAFTKNGGAFTVGVLMGRDFRTGDYIVIHVVRGQWGNLVPPNVKAKAGERDSVILDTCKKDNAWFERRVQTYLEHEPGSQGRDSCEILIQLLAPFYAEADAVKEDKQMRAKGFNSQWQAGNVKFYDGPLGADYYEGRTGGEWIANYEIELGGFPLGKYKDQVDGSSGAFNILALFPQPDLSLFVVDDKPEGESTKS